MKEAFDAKPSEGFRSVRVSNHEQSSPVVMAHMHATCAEEAHARNDLENAEMQNRLASEFFLKASTADLDQRTKSSLKLLAESHAYRAQFINKCRIPNAEESKPPNPISQPSQDHEMPELPFVEDSVEQHEANASKPEDMLTQAAAEMDELWLRLNELGLSRLQSSEKNHLLSSSRHLSSSLGDSFCLLPTKSRGAPGLRAPALDGGATLKAAAASRIRNQRTRLIEKQANSRIPQNIGSNGSDSKASSIPTTGSPTKHHIQTINNEHTLVNGEIKPDDATNNHVLKLNSEISHLRDELSHQKYEVMRLLQTVKTLSLENDTLLKKSDDKAKLLEENASLKESMNDFKEQYHKRFASLKRALEEWRRQKEIDKVHAMKSPLKPSRSNAELDDKIRDLESRLASEMESNKQKDALVKRYEKWYKTLKANAKAKQQSRATGIVTNSTGNMASIEEQMNMESSDFSSRPPAHPGRRNL